MQEANTPIVDQEDVSGKEKGASFSEKRGEVYLFNLFTFLKSCTKIAEWVLLRHRGKEDPKAHGILVGT